MSELDAAKRAAAARALEFVSSGMKLGLGTGSTAAHFVRLLGERVKAEGLNVMCVPTSIGTGKLAERAGLKLYTLEELGWLDLTVDGADEIDAQLRMIKGGGGALLVEKIVAAASDEMICIADESKAVEELGAFPLPIEVVKFGWEATKALIEESLEDFDVDAPEGALRMLGDKPFITDEGHFILDFALGRIGDPDELGEFLNSIPGVVENGLSIDYAARAVIGYRDGTAEVVEAADYDFDEADDEGEADDAEADR